MNKEVNEKKKRYAIVITFLVLMICITGGTYAYFALTASNNSVTGSVGGASLNLTVTKVYPTSEHNSKNMIPQLESTLDEAISLEHKCVDGNGNVICQVYSATVTNVGSISSELNGTIKFEGVRREAGLYDDDWNLLVSWNELVNDYGLKIENDMENNSLTDIIKNNSEFSSVTKIIVEDDVERIGKDQFYNINNITEIALPDEVYFSYSNELSSGGKNIEKIYYSGNNSFAPWGAPNATIYSREMADQMPNLKWMRIADSNTLGTYKSYYAKGEKMLFEERKVLSSNDSVTYYFIIWIDETGKIQYDDGDFRANIEFNSATGGLTSTVRPLLTEYIEKLYNDGSSINTVHIANNTSKQTVNLNAIKGLMRVNQKDTYGEEYRYYGKNPNNYVEFNGELWRILSSSKVYSNESDITGSQRVRLVRAESIGLYPWDVDEDGDGVDTANNNWVTAKLNKILNNDYYNQVSNGTCYIVNENYNTVETICDYETGDVKGLSDEARSLIDDAVWYLGGKDSARDLYAVDFYNFERETMVSTEGYPTRWIGKVGIMYPSDYAYAADLSKCTKTGNNYDTDEANCLNTDWLFNGDYQWFLSPNSADSYFVFVMIDSGYISEDIHGAGGVDVREDIKPVVILRSNVRVMGGKGTSDEPYLLSLSE